MLLQSHAEDNGHLLLGMSEATIAPKKSVYLYRQSLDTCRNTATKNTPTRINPPTLTVANRFEPDVAVTVELSLGTLEGCSPGVPKEEKVGMK